MVSWLAVFPLGDYIVTYACGSRHLPFPLFGVPDTAAPSGTARSTQRLFCSFQGGFFSWCFVLVCSRFRLYSSKCPRFGSNWRMPASAVGHLSPLVYSVSFRCFWNRGTTPDKSTCVPPPPKQPVYLSCLQDEPSCRSYCWSSLHRECFGVCSARPARYLRIDLGAT